MSTDRAQPDLIFVELIHQALRVDGARLLATVSALEPDDRVGRLLGVQKFYARYREQLVSHHTHEDTFFFPALAARVGNDRMHLDELVAQHHDLDAVLAAIGDDLATLGDANADFAAGHAQAVTNLSTMLDHLTTHLDLEERTALPLVVSEIPAGEYRELESKARKATTREQSGFMIPWLVEHASKDQRKTFFRTAPPLRIVYRLTRRRYRQLDEALLPAA